MRIDRRTAALIAAAVVSGSLVMCGLCAAGSALVSNADNDTAKPASASSQATATASPQPTETKPASSKPQASPSPTGTPAPMPAAVGRNAAVVLDELNRAGITNVQLGSVTAGDSVVVLAANWTVVEQSVPAGTVVQPGQPVVLSCRKNAR